FQSPSVAMCRDTPAWFRVSGPSCPRVFQPSLQPGGSSRRRHFLAAESLGRVTRTPSGPSRHSCGPVLLLARGRCAERSRFPRELPERHTDGPLSLPLDTCHLPLVAV